MNKKRMLYDCRRVEVAEAPEQREQAVVRPIVPVGHDLLDALPLDVAGALLSRAMGELSPLDWNALEQEQRDDRLLEALDADTEPDESKEDEKVDESAEKVDAVDASKEDEKAEAKAE